MAIPDVFQNNYHVLCVAFDRGDVCLVECEDAETGMPVYAICAMNRHADGSVTFVPIAKLFTQNPYDELTPPVFQDEPATKE